MNIYQFLFLMLTLFFLADCSKISFNYLLESCSDYELECINCVNDHLCQWYNSNCISNPKEMPTQFENWWEKYVICKSEDKFPSNCGKQKINEIKKGKSFDISLIPNNNIYGKLNLYCYYIYENKNKKAKYKLKGANYLRSQGVLVSVNISHYTTTLSTLWTLNSTMESCINCEDVDKIEVHYYGTSEFHSNPFVISISNEEIANMSIYISISAIVAFCIICTIIIYFYSRKIYKDRELNLQGIEERTRNNNNRNRDENLIVKKRIDELFKTELPPKKYCKSIEGIGNTCTVCIETFKIDCRVCITPCTHVFHYKCLKEWVHKNFSNPKCPNCNYNLLTSILEKENVNAGNEGLENSIPLEIISLRSQRQIESHSINPPSSTRELEENIPEINSDRN